MKPNGPRKPLPTVGKCAWCHQDVKAPSRFNTLVACAKSGMRATAVPGDLPRYTTSNGHTLVVAKPGQAAKPGMPLMKRVAAAYVAAVATFKATGAPS